MGFIEIGVVVYLGVLAVIALKSRKNVTQEIDKLNK